MKKILIIIVLVLLGFVLINNNTRLYTKAKVLPYSLENYENSLEQLQKEKQALKSQSISIKQLSSSFVSAMNTHLFPAWYGTAWSFYGTSVEPQRGSIACGYFVTTLLEHSGVKLDRVKLAQAPSETMIKALVNSKNISRFSNYSHDKFIAAMKKLGNGLYVIGLDNHTGFVEVTDKDIWFIHSGGGFPPQVIKEPLTKHTIAGQSKYKVVGKISSDQRFLNAWLYSNKIQ